MTLSYVDELSSHERDNWVVVHMKPEEVAGWSSISEQLAASPYFWRVVLAGVLVILAWQSPKLLRVLLQWYRTVHVFEQTKRATPSEVRGRREQVEQTLRAAIATREADNNNGDDGKSDADEKP